LREELPQNAPADVIVPCLLALYREELEATGATWPEGLTLDDLVKADVDWQISTSANDRA
jgi:hypothetical protein